MSGSGRVSLPLVRAGFRLTCVDYCEDMLDVFRKKLAPGDRAKLVCQDVSRLALGEKFSLALIPFHSFSEIIDFYKRRLAFAHIFEHLLPGGILFLTLYNPAYRIPIADGTKRPLGRFDLSEGRTLAVSFVNTYSKEDRLIRGVQTYEIFSDDGLVQERTMDICFAVISREEILGMAKETGFAVKEIFGDYSGSPFCEKSPYMNFVLKKP
jgi:SAM-dependent methyltransferase